MILVVERAQLGQDIELVTIPAIPEVQHDIPFADVLFQLVSIAQRVCKEHVFIMLPWTALFQSCHILFDRCHQQMVSVAEPVAEEGFQFVVCQFGI